MSFRNLVIKSSYTIPRDDFVRDLLIPALKEAVSYDRASGYFTSESLLELSEGIEELYKRKGKIRLVISPNLSAQDAAAIEKGYEMRNDPGKYVSDALEDTFVIPKNRQQEEKYNILSHLISTGILEIKVAVMKDNPAIGIFHDKIGIIKDENGEGIAFVGSMNETGNGFHTNHEYLVAFSTTRGEESRVNDTEDRFLTYWNNDDPSISVLPFPESVKRKINEYSRPTINWSLTETENSSELPQLERGKVEIPSYIELRDYQEQAIKKWEASGYRGFFEMATGTGKTITALGAIKKFLDHIKDPLIIVISVPYVHLVTQWEKDLKAFNFKYIAGYSGSSTPRWHEKFKDEIEYLDLGIGKYVCLVTTNSSFRTDRIQKILSDTDIDKLLVVDEVHNFGAKNLRDKLDDRFKYRLGLSATIERHYDKYGTDVLKGYFAPVCITYTLDKAIVDGKLAPYDYYPIVVSLTDDELDKYLALTQEISKHIKRTSSGVPKKKSDGSLDIDETGKALLRKRALIVAGAKNKLDILRLVLKHIGPEEANHLLVYCGATTVSNDDENFDGVGADEIRQIDAVSSILHSEFGLNSAKYTAEVSSDERKRITDRFDKGDIDALVAIRCLDEGVDIPSIDKAIILASSTNEKEYIQRRGRVLRQYPGKMKAKIYDFITLPTKLEEPVFSPKEAGLAKRELKRIIEFKNAALNPGDSNHLIWAIEDKYNIYLQNEEEII